jgi:hypothetical protein
MVMTMTNVTIHSGNFPNYRPFAEQHCAGGSRGYVVLMRLPVGDSRS